MSQPTMTAQRHSTVKKSATLEEIAGEGLTYYGELARTVLRGPKGATPHPPVQGTVPASGFPLRLLARPKISDLPQGQEGSRTDTHCGPLPVPSALCNELERQTPIEHTPPKARETAFAGGTSWHS